MTDNVAVFVGSSTIEHYCRPSPVEHHQQIVLAGKRDTMSQWEEEFPDDEVSGGK